MSGCAKQEEIPQEQQQPVEEQELAQDLKELEESDLEEFEELDEEFSEEW